MVYTPAIFTLIILFPINRGMKSESFIPTIQATLWWIVSKTSRSIYERRKKISETINYTFYKTLLFPFFNPFFKKIGCF